jgi:hypothetical protein
MAVSRFITAGLALATAGAIAAIPAIAPPLAPRDYAVVNETRVQLSADITDLINTFFNKPPGNPKAAGTVGFPGVVQQLLLNANAGDPRAQGVLNAFFGSGASEVVRLLLTRDNLDPVTVAQINAFFNGGVSDLVRLRLWMYADPTQRSYIDKFFNTAVDDAGDPNFPQFGASGVFYKWLSGTGLSTDQQFALDTFFNHGTALTKPDPENPKGPGIPVLDENLEPVFVGSSNPAMFGFSGLAFNAIKASGLSPDQAGTVDDFFNGGASQVVRTRLLASTTDPDQLKDIKALFGDPANPKAPFGLSENVRWRLLAGANGDQRSMDLTNEFFDNGITGVIRYLLVGPVPTPVVTKAAPSGERTSTFAAPADDPVDTTPVDTTPVVKKSDPVDTTVVVKKAAPVAAPAAAPVAAAAPAVAPPAVKPKFNAKISEKETDDANEIMKNGGDFSKNGDDPIIIEGGGGPKPGEGSWGVFGAVAGAIGNFISGGAAAPAAPAAPAGGGAEGGAGE